MDGILKWLPLGAAILAGGIAWGSQQMQIKTLEQAQVRTTQIQATQADLRVQAAKTEAQAKQAAEQSKQNHDLLLQLLQRLQ